VNILNSLELDTLLKCRIKVRLAELEQSQKELAEFMNVSKQTMNGWATGRIIPPMEKAFKIAKFLGCKVDDLWEYREGDY
jgi:DNA-binding XRE family transcriptional regulator